LTDVLGNDQCTLGGKRVDQTGTLTLLVEVAEELCRSARVVADADAPERPRDQGQGDGERDGPK
jgi:hypothetical protein